MTSVSEIQTAKSLVIEARRALRRAYIDGGCGLSHVEKAYLDATSKLIRAVDMVANDLVPDAPPGAIDDLEDIYANITGTRSTKGGQRRFVISFPEVTLGLDEIWPDGDAPEYPSPEDVIEAMKATEYAHPMAVTSAWRLIDTLYIRYEGDDKGDMEVEWDGSD